MTLKQPRCGACRTDVRLPAFTMAFQPIIDIETGHSGLNMLVDFQPDVLKIDMALTRAINTDTAGRRRLEIA